MKKRIITLIVAAILTLCTSGPAWATCTSHTYIYPDGRLVHCTVCCFASSCTTTCF